jgi:pyruvate,water dikinase
MHMSRSFPCTNNVVYMKPYIKVLSETGINDIAIVGGKNSSLGEMISHLSAKGIKVPDGFAVTSFAFQDFLSHNNLHQPLNDLLRKLDTKHYTNLSETGNAARNLMNNGTFPEALSAAIAEAYANLCGGDPLSVAVRSSATAEDLPQASFAGQHDSYLNINGDKDLLAAVKKCFASMYTDRAIKYREDHGFLHEKVALSVGVQKMVRADEGSAGIIFTLEPESGFRDIIHISAVWGLGENIVQGSVTPDEYFVFKPTLRSGKNAILQRKLGEKGKTMIYGANPQEKVHNIPTTKEKQAQFVLTPGEIAQLAKWALIIEDHYARPMDIEWAKDGFTNEIYIVQARPETVHAQRNQLIMTEYEVMEKGTILTRGEAIGTKIATGVARVLKGPEQSASLHEGEIVVTDLTSPDWDPVLKKASAIITNKGGRTSHASIVARELGVPAVVGCDDATQTIKDGELITVSCCEGKTGFVYRGKMKFKETTIDFSKIPKPSRTKVMLIVGEPEKAFKLSFYPNDGVGLMRAEFIITHSIGIHPMALVRFDALKDESVKKKIAEMTKNYPDKAQYFVDKLAEGVATIAAAFYPKDVIVRMSDFKTNEYAGLLGGAAFEPPEENPMIGFRGASRYYHELYRDGFRLECAAIKKVRDEMGLINVKVMIPFCRTTDEGSKVIHIMELFGLGQGVNGLEIYVMAEVPSNVILADQFAELFDGFSIGSNDLTQLTLGIDRDSSIISHLFDERNDAPREMIARMIMGAKQAGRKIGLCGQAPSDFPEFAKFLVAKGIDSISFNPDALLKGIQNICEAEKARVHTLKKI